MSRKIGSYIIDVLRILVVNRSWRQIFLKLLEFTILVVTITIPCKKIILTTSPRGSYFKVLVNKIIGFVHIQYFLKTDFFFTIWNPRGFKFTK